MAWRPGHQAAAGLRMLIAILAALPLVQPFNFVPDSPCASVCRSGKLETDAVCQDAEYKTTDGGRRVEECVGCLLNSTAVDTASDATDVGFGLLNLRYTLSSCMFGKPVQRVSISSPCQVTCAPLNASIGYQITNDTAGIPPNLDFCTASRFDDTTINNCAFCYSFIPQQLFTANILQALHIACREPLPPGEVFFPDADTIFNATLISGPAPPSNSTGGGGGLHGSTLAIAIALPIVGGILVIGGACWGCFAFTRRRRRMMAASGRMDRVHDAHADSGSMYSPVSGKQMWGEHEPPREMSQLTPRSGRHPSPGFAQGRWSHHYPPGTALSPDHEDGTPLRNSFQREDIGPGPHQVQDPDLHEQYFGVADGGEDDVAGPSQQHGLGVYDGQPRNYPVRQDERGHFVQ